MPDPFRRAIVIGDACVDIHMRIADIEAEDQNTPIPFHMSSGGTIGNTAMVLNDLGVETAFLGTVGKDFGGHFIRSRFSEMGIDTSLMIDSDDLNTINVFAFIDDQGERHLWGYPRTQNAYPELDIDLVDKDKIRTASWLHSSGMTMLKKGSIQKSLPELFRIAFEAGVPTSFDLNTRVSDLSLLEEEAVEAIRKTIPYVRYLTGSGKDEFMSFYPCEDWKESVRHFADGGSTVIARMGKEGFLAIFDGTERSCPSYEVEVVDTTGAGDSFDAGFIAASLEGKGVYEACLYANAVSGYRISRRSDELKIDRENIRAFMEKTALRNDI